MAEAHRALYRTIGRRVRELREARSQTQRALAESSRLSLRFLAEVESGQSNISVGRLADLAGALRVPLASLLPDATDPSARNATIALLGLRGAGKSSVGRALAQKLGRELVELDEEIERRAGLRLAEIFEIHGEAYYRRLEREVLRELLASGRSIVLATGGGIVSDAETYALLRRGARTLWLRAAPEDHWARVIAQGDARPMADRPRAMAELRALLDARAPLYARAEHIIDTSGRKVSVLVNEAIAALR